MSKHAALLVPISSCTRHAVGGWGKSPVEVETIRKSIWWAVMPERARAAAAAAAARSEVAWPGAA
jgi:hypothetical protein